MNSSPERSRGDEFLEWWRTVTAATGSVLENAQQGLIQLRKYYLRGQDWLRTELQDQFRNGVTREHVTGALMTATAVGSVFLGRSIVRRTWTRYFTAGDIPMSLVERGLKLQGVVVRVPDGDGMRVYHTPSIRWLLERWRIPQSAGRASNSIYELELILHDILDLRCFTHPIYQIRLAGIDAPEMANFGHEGQKYAAPAQEFLARLVMRKKVTFHVHGFDTYDRAISTVYVRGRLPFFRRNVSMELTREGYAVVYRGQGAEYGGLLRKYVEAEAHARWEKRGMWKAGKKLVLPSEYKRAIKNGKGNGNRTASKQQLASSEHEMPVGSWRSLIRSVSNFLRGESHK